MDLNGSPNFNCERDISSQKGYKMIKKRSLFFSILLILLSRPIYSAGDDAVYDYADRQKKKAAERKQRYNSYDLIYPDSPWGKSELNASDIANRMQTTSEVSWKEAQKKKQAAEGATSQPTTRPGDDNDDKPGGPVIEIGNPPRLGPTTTRTRGTDGPKVSSPPSGPSYPTTGPTHVSTCEEGNVRYPNKDNVVKTCVYKVPTPPKVKITSESEHGRYAVEGAEDFLGNLSKIFSALDVIIDPSPPNVAGGAAGIPTGPMGYAGFAADVGGKATKAAAKWGKQNAKKLVNFSAEFNMQKITVKCTPFEVCKNGNWVPGGIWPADKPAVENLNEKHTYNHRKNPIEGKELGQAMRMMYNWYNRYTKELEQFENDPCGCGSAASSPAGQGGGTPGVVIKPPPSQKKSCDPIRAKIAEDQKGIEKGEKTLEQLKKDLETHKKQLEETRRAWEEAKKKAQADLKNAERESKNAQAAWEMLLANVGSYSSERYEQLGKEYGSRLDRAEEALQKVKDNIATIDKKYQYDVGTLDAYIKLDNETMEKIRTILETYRTNLKLHKKELDACLKSGGI